MRKFKLQVQTSVDGYMAGPNGEMDWLTFSWTDDVKAYVTALTQSVDRIVLGRKLAEGSSRLGRRGPRARPRNPSTG